MEGAPGRRSTPFICLSLYPPSHLVYRFFNNKGAVAGVFLIVGLAAASIVLFLFFFIRKRRRNRRLEYDTAVASTLAAAGYTRTPLDGDDDGGKVMSQRRGSTPSALNTISSMPSAGRPEPYRDDPTDRGPRDFDPYAAYGTVPPQTPPPVRKDGYVPARTGSPPLGHSHSASTSSMGHAIGHATRESAGSFEPLLAAGSGSVPPTPGPVASSSSSGPPVPPRSPNRPPAQVSDEEAHHPIRDSASSVYSNGEADDLLVDLTPRQPLEVRPPESKCRSPC